MHRIQSTITFLCGAISSLCFTACGPETEEASEERNAAFLVEPKYETIEEALVETKSILQPTSYLENAYTGKNFAVHPEDIPLRKLKVGLSWIANDQFSVYYVAQKKGFFRDAGLEVELIPGGPGKNPLGLLLAGQLDFVSSSNGSAVVRMQHSRTGGDLVAVGALLRKYPYAWVGLDPKTPSDERSNRTITREDFIGRTIGAEPGSEYLTAFTLEQLGIDPDELTITRTSTQIEPLLAGAFDYMTCWADNIPRMLEDQGHKNWFLWEFAENGWVEFGNVIVTNRKMITEDPEVIERYLWALSRAVTFVIEHPDEAVEIAHASMPGTNLTPELIRKRLAYQKELSEPIEGMPLLSIDPDKWEQCAALLLYYGVIEKLPPYLLR